MMLSPMQSTSTLDIFALDQFGPTEALAAKFRSDHYLRLPGLVRPEAVERLSEEIARLRALAIRRDFAMECMDNSPRKMSTIGGEALAEESVLIPGMYESPELVDFISRVFGEELQTVPDPIERHVINFLHESGDTHGGHFDDHPVALIVFVESPPAHAGGLIEYVPMAGSLSELGGPRSRRAHHEVGDGYLLKSDTTAHRVTPLAPGFRRTAMNFAYTTPEGAAIASPSASLLYSRS